jgi:hypothetical protein
MATSPNSNWFQATNSVLLLTQLPQVASPAIFDANQLTKYQSAARYKVDFAHRHLTLKMVTAFTNRKFQLPIQQGVTDYQLDTGISAESLKYHSWYNITAGSPYTGFLPLMKYEDYMNAWPDQTIIQSGPPQYVVQLPYDRQLDLNEPQPRIRIFPIPDNSYTLQYQARLNYYPLVSSGSIILWPPEYEHGLWSWAWKFLEIDLAEGREQMLDAMVDDVISRIRTVSQSAEEVRKGVRVCHLNGRYGRRFRGSYFGG